jgi:hypothetical protein
MLTMTYGLFSFCIGVVDYQHTNSRRYIMTIQSTNPVAKNSASYQSAKTSPPAPQPLTRHLGTGYGRSSGYARSSSYQRDFSGFKYL